MNQSPQKGRTFEDFLAEQGQRPRLWLTLIAVLLALQISPWWHNGKDAGAYLSIARGMAHGVLANHGQPHLHYAPGYPLLIAPAFWLGKRPFFVLSIMHWLMAVALALGVYRWMKRIAPGGALWLTMFVMVNTSLWYYYQQTLSELAFMTAMVWTALLLHHAEAAPARRTWAAAAVALLAALIRQVGLFVVAGHGLASALRAWRKQTTWRSVLHAGAITCAAGLPAAAAVYAVILRERATTEPDATRSSYLSYFIDNDATLAIQIIEGLRLRISEIGRILVPGMYKTYARAYEWMNVNVAIYGVVSALVLIGWFRLAWKKPDALLWALPLYLGLYIVWPFDQGTRYMMPMLPVLAASLWPWLARYPRHRLSILAILTAAQLCVSLGTWARSLPGVIADHRLWPRIEVIAAPARGQTQRIGTLGLDSARVRMLRFATDRSTIELNENDLIDTRVQWIAASAGKTVPGPYVLAAQADDVAIYQRKAEAR